VAWISKGQGFIGCLERFKPEHLRRWIALNEANQIAEPKVVAAETLRK